jgi:predicted phosphodiesterase
MKKLIALPDIHYPDQHKPSMALVEQFLPDFKPDIIIYLGDSLDLEYISRHTIGNRRLMEGRRLKRDYSELSSLILKHRKLAGNPKVIYFIGNHEDWVRDYIDQNPNMESFGEIENNLKGVDEFVPLNKTYNVGKLYFLHGVYQNQYHAKKHVDNYKRNIIYGHTHTIQVHTSVSPIDRQDYHTAKSIGCLCIKNPKYMENRPSAWVNGFYVAYVDEKTGFFSDYQIVINNGSFIFNGKKYKA